MFRLLFLVDILLKKWQVKHFVNMGANKKKKVSEGSCADIKANLLLFLQSLFHFCQLAIYSFAVHYSDDMGHHEDNNPNFFLFSSNEVLKTFSVSKTIKLFL